MISKKQRANAERIKLLSDTLGHLPFNAHGQTTTQIANLTIPCAILVCAGIVTGVDRDTNDGLTDGAVEDVERHIRLAVGFATEQHGRGWWNVEAERLGL